MYDDRPFGQATATGNVTATQTVDHFDSAGNPVFVTTATSVHDAYGRTTSVTDPNITDAQHPNGAVTTTTYTAAHAGELPSSGHRP
ncbi:hypothetical protein [Streptomyces sp. CBMA29]|uniref:hypothetical protein n=1 Tax=Streptomyces sp. CBMA29 TaxID=1896314 RepID=UPI001661A9BD|nr:hypothetical protein [Streptomyces sp. CBMA29]MBD0739395.1 hypothetical protein [Streptomyces sp. CBMA29]